MVVDHEQMGDPLEQREPTEREARAQSEAERLRESLGRSHFHEFVTGESAGSYYSHTHDADELGHVHDGRQAFPARADGGYWEECGPSLGPQTPPEMATNVARALRLLIDSPKTPDHQLMRWRLRLFCGHVVERTAHVSHRTARAAFAVGAQCPECGLDPATIIAARTIGLVADPPQALDPNVIKTEALQRQLARARVEVDRLEAALAKKQPEHS